VDYFTAFAERTEPDYGRWLNNMEAEHNNFRAALASSETRLRLALALCGFWHRRGHLNEGSGWLANALKQHEGGLFTTAADHVLRARALDTLGVFRLFQGDLDTAQTHLEASLALFRELDDTAHIAEVLGDFGMLFQMRGDYEQAGNLLEEGLMLYRELGNTGGIAYSHFFLGILAYSQGHTQRAGRLWEESLMGMRAQGTTWGIANVLPHLAMVALDQGSYSRANGQLVESLTLLRELGERWQIVQTLEVFASLATEQGRQLEDSQPHLLRAARIFGAAEVLRETFRAPKQSFNRNFYERSVVTLRAQLDGATLAVAWAEGRAMTLDQVVAYALSERYKD
jgi:tetratricopeptide (TPR) repeat protein